jgi:predicted ABC-type ATPase
LPAPTAVLSIQRYDPFSLETRTTVNREFEQFVEDHIRRGISFAIETTLRSDITFHQMDRARVQGFEVYMLYVALSDFSRNLKRVTDRARAGGHSAPAEQLLRIHQASLANLPRAVREADDLKRLHITAPGGPTQFVLSAKSGIITFQLSPCPELAEAGAGSHGVRDRCGIEQPAAANRPVPNPASGIGHFRQGVRAISAGGQRTSRSVIIQTEKNNAVACLADYMASFAELLGHCGVHPFWEVDAREFERRCTV